MNVCVFGAGAMGCYLAAKLATSPTLKLTVVARGKQLFALQGEGIHLRELAGQRRVHLNRVVSDEEPVEAQDIVFVALKAYSQEPNLARIASMLKSDGFAVFISNGLPWWYDNGAPASHDELAHHAHVLASAPTRFAQCIAYSTNALVKPGHIVHSGNNLWRIGVVQSIPAEQLQLCAALMLECGLDTQISADVRRDIWIKLLRNGSLGSVAALTRCTHDVIGSNPQLLKIVNRLIDEIASVALVEGFDVRGEIDAAKQVARLAAEKAAAQPNHDPLATRPSILGDVLAGNSIEHDALLGKVKRIADRRSVVCPTIDIVLPLLQALDIGNRAH
ncbi:MAG: ketopantoate reductase family protein [Casimicrobium sp.]